MLIDEFDAHGGGRSSNGGEPARTIEFVLRSGRARKSANACSASGRRLGRAGILHLGGDVVAGIGKIPDTVEDRSVVLRLKRKLASEKVARFRGRDGGELLVLARKIVRFVADNEHRLRRHRTGHARALNEPAIERLTLGSRCSPLPTWRAATGRNGRGLRR